MLIRGAIVVFSFRFRQGSKFTIQIHVKREYDQYQLVARILDTFKFALFLQKGFLNILKVC